MEDASTKCANFVKTERELSILVDIFILSESNAYDSKYFTNLCFCFNFQLILESEVFHLWK
jgi:hypothetical protein